MQLAGSETSPVAKHAHKTRHNPNWNDVNCIDQDSHWHMQKVKEAMQIRLHPYNNISRDCGIELHELWMPIIRKHAGRFRTANHSANILTIGINRMSHPVYTIV